MVSRTSTAILCSIAASGGIAACSALIGIEDRPLGDLDATATSATTADGATSTNDGSNAPSLEGCDASPTARPDVLDERCGVFVAPTGVDASGRGTRALPLRSFAFAVRAAIEQQKFRVFACGGVYDEHVEMLGEGASIVGGLSCDTPSWAVGAQLTVVRRSDEGVALRMDRTTRPIVFERVQFEAPNATTPGASSIVAQLTNVAGATFIDCVLDAGVGQAGANGHPGFVGTGGGAAGNAASGATAGAERRCTCTLGTTNVGTTVGGAGGSAVAAASAGAPALGGGGAGTNAADTCTGGGAGAAGRSGDAGAMPTSVGTLSNETWLPASGNAGDPGAIGQGGGGGGAYTDTLNGTGLVYAGGSGGCGGCPSTGGTGGQGGGASIGILSVDSAVELRRTAIQTHQAGAGGNGADSVAGQPGGAGQGNGSGNGCSGGQGGAGGAGGPGSGGAGGCSIGILVRGQAPTVDADSTQKFVIGSAGMGGTGRVGGPKHFAYAPDGGSYVKLDVPL